MIGLSLYDRKMSEYGEYSHLRDPDNSVYGVVHCTSGDHYTIAAIDYDGVELHRTHRNPAIDCNGNISFPNPVEKGPLSCFKNEFEMLTRVRFFEIFPELKNYE